MQELSDQLGVPLGSVIFSGEVKELSCSVQNNRLDKGEECIIIIFQILLHIPLFLCGQQRQMGGTHLASSTTEEYSKALERQM